MEGRDQPSDPGYDDWFDEPEPLTEETGRPGRSAYDESVEDVWVLPEERPPRRRQSGRGGVVVGGRTLSAAQLAVVGIAAIAIILAILAATGVFSSNAAAPPTSSNTNPPPTHPRSVSTATGTTPAVVAPTQALKPGDTGTQVKLLQKALTALGYSPGKADGDYGPSTVAAVKQFQTAKGLTADGIAGPQTISTLAQALSG
jgi:Putative peptidoglycan binding domain